MNVGHVIARFWLSKIPKLGYEPKKKGGTAKSLSPLQHLLKCGVMAFFIANKWVSFIRKWREK
ncbi:hypothetical protein COC46_07290 [Bacillus sp. AFS041924]|nr:hypothetical protein COC46_07290 [Bacillus sp. AFS041924]